MYKEAFYKMAADNDNGSFLGGAVTGTLGTLGAGTAAILANKKFGLLSKLLSKFKGAPLKDTPLKATIKGVSLSGAPLKDLEGFKAPRFSDHLNSFDPRGIGFMDFLKSKGGITGKAKEMGLPAKSKLDKVLYKKLANGTTLKFDPAKDDASKFLNYIERMMPKVKRNSKDYKDLVNMQQELKGSI